MQFNMHKNIKRSIPSYTVLGPKCDIGSIQPADKYKYKFLYPCRGYNDFSQKFATQWRRRIRPHKVYIYSWSASL